jgi:phosphopantetheinyl transferase (holo-ACP synthase)
MPLTVLEPKATLPFMVVSVGVDMTEISRIRQALEDPKTGLRFRDRVYTDGARG